MEYTKPSLSYEEQADLLLRRGLVADRNLLIVRLKSASYYRLSGYWYPFRQPDDTLKSGTTLKVVWRRYAFDRRFRLLIMDSLERFEVAVRTRIVCLHSKRFGPFGYSRPETVPNLAPTAHHEWLSKLGDETDRSKEVFVRHFREQYGDCHPHLPIWMAGEIMSFGSLLTFFRGMDTEIKKAVAAEFGVADVVFESWIGCLNVIRNICAHHGRLWNRVLGYKPQIPAKQKEWHDPFPISNERIFGVLTICLFLLRRIAPQSQWPSRLMSLIGEYPDIPLKEMGFGEEWQKHALWRGVAGSQAKDQERGMISGEGKL